MRLLFLLIFTSCAQLEDRPSSEKIIRKFYETSVWKEGAPKRAQWDKHVRHTFYNSFSYREKKALELVHEKAWSSLPKRDQLFDAIVKNKNQRQEFCKEIPKGGMLHVHPTGLVTREFLTKKIKSFKKKINPLDLLKSGTEGPRKELKKEEIRFLKQLKSKKFNSYTLVEQNKIIDLMFLKIEKAPFDFIRFQAVFSLLRYFIPKNKKIEFEILKDFLLNARNLGISYVELTNVFDFPINMKTLRNTTRRLYKETGVHVRWNVAFIRDNNKEKNRKLRDHLLSFKNRKDLYPIVGIDLVANEKTNDSLEHWEIYRPIIESGLLSSTIHAGEMGNPHNVRDALLMGVNRVGHGVLVQDDHLSMESMVISKKAVEVNLKSNLILGVVSEMKEHPFLKFHRIGIPITFSTDDEGIFETDMAKECMLALEKSNITYNELKEAYFNSLHFSFAQKDLKKQLLHSLKKDYRQFEKKWQLKSN